MSSSHTLLWGLIHFQSRGYKTDWDREQREQERIKKRERERVTESKKGREKKEDLFESNRGMVVRGGAYGEDLC